MADNTTDKARQAFIDEIMKKTRTALGSQLDGELVFVSYPPGFNFQTTYGGSGYANPASLTKIDYLVTGDQERSALDGSSSFSGLYRQILQSTTFSLSDAEKAIIQQADERSSAARQTLIRAFEDAYGPIRPAADKSKLDYIKSFIKNDLGADPTELDATVEIPYLAWRAAARDGLVIGERQDDANNRLKAAIRNLRDPSQANGGAQTSGTEFLVGYDNVPSSAILLNGLKNKGNKVVVACRFEHDTNKSSSFSIGGKTGFSVPVKFLTIGVEGKAEYALDELTNQGQAMTMKLEFTGVTTIAPSPRPLSANGTNGWYDKQILVELVSNAEHNGSSGYTFASEEWKGRSPFGPNGALVRTRTLVLSNRPTVTLVFHQANDSTVKSMFDEQLKIGVSLGGLLEVGSVNQKYSRSTLGRDEQSGDITVTLGPDTFTEAGVPEREQTCHVLGAVLSRPPSS